MLVKVRQEMARGQPTRIGIQATQALNASTCYVSFKQYMLHRHSWIQATPWVHHCFLSLCTVVVPALRSALWCPGSARGIRESYDLCHHYPSLITFTQLIILYLQSSFSPVWTQPFETLSGIPALPQSHRPKLSKTSVVKVRQLDQGAIKR